MSSNIRRHDILERLGIEQLPALVQTEERFEDMMDAPGVSPPIRSLTVSRSRSNEGVAVVQAC